MADKIYSMQSMGAKGEGKRDLQPPWLLEACSPPCRRKFQFLLEEFWQNDVPKLHFLAISASGRKTVGSCGSSYPSVRRFLSHPCLKIDLSQTFQEVFTAQVMEISHKAVDCIVS